MFQEKFEASEEKIISSNIYHPPSSSLLSEVTSCVDNAIFVINNLGNEKNLHEKEQSFLALQAIIIFLEVGKRKDQIGKTSIHYHANEIQDDSIHFRSPHDMICVLPPCYDQDIVLVNCVC